MVDEFHYLFECNILLRFKKIFARKYCVQPNTLNFCNSLSNTISVIQENFVFSELNFVRLSIPRKHNDPDCLYMLIIIEMFMRLVPMV